MDKPSQRSNFHSPVHARWGCLWLPVVRATKCVGSNWFRGRRRSVSPVICLYRCNCYNRRVKAFAKTPAPSSDTPNTSRLVKESNACLVNQSQAPRRATIEAYASGTPKDENESNAPRPFALDVNQGGRYLNAQAGTGSLWTELYRGRGEHFDVEGLRPCRRYFFRARLLAPVAARRRVLWR